MTTLNNSELSVQLRWDEDGSFIPLTADECVAALSHWAHTHPSARFAVVAVDPDGSDATVLGWGLAVPEYVFAHLPTITFTGHFSTAAELLRVLRASMDARLIWLDPEPRPLPEDPEAG